MPADYDSLHQLSLVLSSFFTPLGECISVNNSLSIITGVET